MRTTKGSARNRAKRRLFRKAKGYRGGRNNLLRTVKETLLRSGQYAYLGKSSLEQPMSTLLREAKIRHEGLVVVGKDSRSVHAVHVAARGGPTRSNR